MAGRLRSRIAVIGGIFVALATSGMSESAAQVDFAAQRARMVAEIDALYAQTRSETGIASMSARVRVAMARVERHRLVPKDRMPDAYRNHPLPIGNGQTISQPYIVALSADLVSPAPGDVVLDVGTGSGYQAAVLAELAARVYSIERIEALGKSAAARLAEMAYRNVEVTIGDGYLGLAHAAPFDCIVVTAAAPHVPPALLEQLKPGGRMVIPLGADGEIQFLTLITRSADGSVSQRRVIPVRFVPLIPGAVHGQ